MRTDDNTSAEFLFGTLASNYLDVQSNPNLNFQVTNGHIKRFNLLLPVYLILELVLLVTVISLSSDVNQFLYFIIVLGAIRLLIIALKNKSLVNRYAPDLVQFNSTSYSFALVQLVLSGLIFAVFSFLFLFITSFIPEITFQDRLKITTIAIIIFYVNFISDLSLTALAKGIGVMGHSNKFQSLLINVKDLANVKGRQSIPLAMLRILNWFLIYYIITILRFDSLIYPFFALSIYYQNKWEKVNSASLFMEIRGEIATGKPAILPHKLFIPQDQSIDTDKSNYTMNENSISNLFFNYQKNPGKRRVRNVKLQNLGSIAARSLTRIADTIKKEENQMPSNLMSYCNNCNMEVINSRNFCSYCGERNLEF